MSSIPFSPEDLRRLARDRAAAEQAELAGMVAFRDAEVARIAASDATSMRKLIERSAIALEIGQAVGLSEGQVFMRLAIADRVIEHAPRVWLAFRAGAVDFARVREVSTAVERLQRDESRQELDAKAVNYAVTHTVSELRQWLRRFITRAEADLSLERAAAEHAKRHVSIAHVEDGMAWLNAYLPSHQAAAIASRLRREATATGDDARTHAQCEADLLVEHLLNAPAGQAEGAGPKIDIAVTIDADVLTGAIDGFAESTDNAWEVPAAWLLESALVGEAFWHRLLVDPFTGDTLAHTYTGYSPPDTLRRAIRFRDGVCDAPGCLIPADRCELDHATPWPTGATTAANLHWLCKRHHAIKGHAALPALLVKRRSAQHERHRTSPYEHSRAEELLSRRLASLPRD